MMNDMNDACINLICDYLGLNQVRIMLKSQEIKKIIGTSEQYKLLMYNDILPYIDNRLKYVTFKNKIPCIRCYISAIRVNANYNLCYICSNDYYLNNIFNEISIISFERFKKLNTNIIHKILSNEDVELFNLSIINSYTLSNDIKVYIRFEINREPLEWAYSGNKYQKIKKLMRKFYIK